MTFGKNTLAITANSPEFGEALRNPRRGDYKGKEIAIAFNPRYLTTPWPPPC